MSHSRPLAAWNDARVTPLHRGRVLGRGALLELAHEGRESGVGLEGVQVVGQRRQGAQRLPPVAGRAAAGGRPASSRPRAARRARGRAAAPTRRRSGPPRAAARWRRGPPCARRTARRRARGRGCRARPAPTRTPSLWPLVRKSTAISDGGWPCARRGHAMRVATVAASSGSLSATSSSGVGPSGRWARSSTEPERRWPPGPLQHEVGQAHDLRRRAVVAHELDGAGVGVPGAEPEQVLGRGAGEGVDRLGRVADDAEVACAPPSQRSSRVCWSRLTSWYSSTTKWRYWPRTARATSSCSRRMPTMSSRTSSKSMTPRSVLTSS